MDTFDHSEAFRPFPEADLGALDDHTFPDALFGTDFQWNQGWDFSVADQLFSTVTDPRGDTLNHGLPFWDRTFGS
jgi:hypothetical protein